MTGIRQKTVLIVLSLLLSLITFTSIFDAPKVKATISLKSEIFRVTSFVNSSGANHWIVTSDETEPWLNTKDGDTSKIWSGSSNAKSQWYILSDTIYTDWVNVTKAEFRIRMKQDVEIGVTNMYLYFWNWTTQAQVLYSQLIINQDTWTNFTYGFNSGYPWNPEQFHEYGDVAEQLNDMKVKVAMMADTYTTNHITYAEMRIEGYAGEPLYAGGNDTTILNMEGCGNWLFAQERFYLFNMTTQGNPNWTMLDMSGINFTDNGGQTIVAYWDFSTNQSMLTTGKDIAGIRTGEFLYNSTGDNATCWFIIEIMLTENIIDSRDVDLYMITNLTSGYTTGWEKIENDYFWIYSKGGLTNMTDNGLGGAGLLTGGQTFDLYAGVKDVNGTDWVRKEIFFRDLQSVHGLYMLNSFDDGDTIPNGEHENIGLNGYFEFGMDYCTETTDWIQGWKALVELYSWGIGVWGSTNNQTWNIEWYDWMENGGWVWTKTDKVQSYHENNEGFEDDGIRLFVDLWYGHENGSSVGEGRVSSYYKAWEGGFFPWDGGNPIMGNYISTYMTNLYDDSGNIVYYEQIKIMRFWVRLYRDPYYQPTYNADTWKEVWEIDHVEGLNYHITPTIEATDEPTWVEPKDPEAYSWGFFEPLRIAVMSIGNSIVQGLLTAISFLGVAIVGGMDWSLEQIFHQPNIFSGFIYQIGLFLGQLGVYSGWIVTFFIQAITFIGSILTLIAMFIFNIFSFIGSIASSITGSISGAITMFSELWTGTGIFSGMGIGFGEIFNIAIIGFWVFLMAGTVTYGFGWLFGWVEKGMMILTFVKEILLFGYEMLKGFIEVILGILPF